MSFQPNVNDRLTFRGKSYRVAEHPASPGSPYAIQGRQSVVYQLIAVGAGEQGRYALKVFEPRYRMPTLVSVNDTFLTLAGLPGLSVCDRQIINASHDVELLRQYPDLSYAVWMPWVDGLTWMETMLTGAELTAEESLRLARGLAQTLVSMEERGLAHCDLTGGNVILVASTAGSLAAQPIELVDVEQLYAAQLTQPPEMAPPVPGYTYRKGKARWRADADRFAGAVLLAEMLGWCDADVRKLAWGEHYFDPKEMQQDSERYQSLRRAIRERWGKAAAALFKRAWRSETPAECPTFLEWLSALPHTTADAETVGREEAPEAEESMAPQPTGEQDAAIGALISLARQLEGEGNFAGALAAYRQAQSLAVGQTSLARELGQMIDSLHSRLSQPAEISQPAEPQATTMDEAAALPAHPPWEMSFAEELTDVAVAETLPGEPPTVVDLTAAQATPPAPVTEYTPGEVGEVAAPIVAPEPHPLDVTPPAAQPPRPLDLPPSPPPIAPPDQPSEPARAGYEPAPAQERTGGSCLAWAALLIIGIAAGMAVYYFVFMQHGQQVSDLLSRVMGRQTAATVAPVERRAATPETAASPAKPAGQPTAGEMAPTRPPAATVPSPAGARATALPTPTSEPAPSPAGVLPAASPQPAPTITVALRPTSAGLALGQTRVREADGMVMVAVPAGQFRMGATDAELDDVLRLCQQYSGNCDREWFAAEQPAHTVSLKAFWLDKTEVTNAQFARFLNAQEPQALKDLAEWINLSDSTAQVEKSGDGYQPKSGYAGYPVSLVSWAGAQAYCQWAGARLLTEAEWEYAARGPDSRIFPWGNEFEQSRLNYESRADGYEDLAPVGSFLNGASWCGALDMAGNVAEWVADWMGPYKAEPQNDPQGPALGQYRVNKGGSFQSKVYETRGSARGAANPADLNRAIGFRCAAGP